MLEAWTRACPKETAQDTLNSGPAGTVFTVQLEGEIIVHTGFAQDPLNRQQVEERCKDVTG
jgi:hypothetical protein